MTINLDKFVEIYTSISDAISSTVAITVQNTVCLINSILTFSLSLFFTIDLYNFIPLTDVANITGINIMLCKNKPEIIVVT